MGDSLSGERERGSGSMGMQKQQLPSWTSCVSDDGSVVELSLHNEITHPFPTNEANLERSRPSLESHQISPSCFDCADKTELEAQTLCVTKQKLEHGDYNSFSFLVFSEEHRRREQRRLAAA